MQICIQKFQNKYFNTHTKPIEISMTSCYVISASAAK